MTSSKATEIQLTEYQANFVSHVLAMPLPARHLLIAPPGSGKTAAALALARKVASGNPAYRLLVVGPMALAAMYLHQLSAALPDGRATVVTRRLMREFEATADAGEPKWPVGFTALMSLETAGHPNVRPLLASVTWDLVIVEEVQLYGRLRRALLKRILSEPAFSRVLLITATPEPKTIFSLWPGLSLTEWRSEELKDRDGKPVFARETPHFVKVPFRRGPEELELMRSVVSLAELLSTTHGGQLMKRTLLRQAASSPVALEQTLRSMRSTLTSGTADLIQADNSKKSQEEVTSSFRDTDVEISVFRSAWRTKARALGALEAAIDQLETVHNDAKREAFEELIEKLGLRAGTQSRACVFCSSRATANYLHTTLTDRGLNAWVLTGGTSVDEVEQQLEGFSHAGGVLVTTVAILKGLELPGVNALVHYDAPMSEAETRVRISRNTAARNYYLAEQAGILPSEGASSR